MGRATEIIRLERGDTGLVNDLLTVFADAFDEPETYNDRRPDGGYLDRVLGSDACIVLAALQGQRIVGGLVAYELPKIEQARSEIYIYDLAVVTDARRQGIATRLIRKLQRVAAERDAWVIFVQADHGDDAAIALYSKLGTREDVLHFDIDVGHVN